MTTQIQSFVIVGGATFAATKFLWDASTTKALIFGAVVGAIAYYFAIPPQTTTP